MTCKSGALTLDGSRFSNIKKIIFVTSKKKIDALRLAETKISKDKQFLLVIDKMVPIKDGKFFILTRRQPLKPRDSMKNLDSISTDHSTLFQNFHSTELLSVLEPTTLPSRDGERMSLDNNTTSTRFQRPLDLNNGRTMLWQFNPMVDQQTSTSHLASTLDGGNCSDSKKEHTLSMRKERLWMYQVDLIMRTKTSL